jgi:MoaA/NifB/PqqE/SkfB family radical SAM enzyme
MFRIADITTIDIESINNCNAECPLCLRGAKMKTNDILDWDKVVSNIPMSVWRTVKHINFNGTTGDNLMHPRINDIVIWTCENTSAFISLHTNGGIRDTSWWHTFGAQLKCYQHRVVFGIDGLDDTHSIYRVGTNWQKVINNATAFIQGGGNAEWQFIIFKHNAHQVEQARELSQQLGFKKFFVIFQDRFDQSGQVISKDNIIEKFDIVNTDFPILVKSSSNNIEKKIAKSNKVITCRSQQVGWISIYADGTIWPCCWLMGWHKANHFQQFSLIDYHFKKVLKIDFCQISIYNSDLEAIINSNIWQENYTNSFRNKPNPVCLQQCSDNKE